MPARQIRAEPAPGHTADSPDRKADIHRLFRSRLSDEEPEQRDNLPQLAFHEEAEDKLGSDPLPGMVNDLKSCVIFLVML